MIDGDQKESSEERLRRVVIVAGRRTSLYIETPVWDQLQDIATRERLRIDDLLTLLDQRRDKDSLAAAARAFVLMYWRVLAEARLPQPAPGGWRDPAAPAPTPSPLGDSWATLGPPVEAPVFDRALRRFESRRSGGD